jgi:hypothetical protein
MTRAPSPGRRRAAGGSVIAALVFNAAALMLPFAGAGFARSFAEADLIDYSPTPAAVRNTRAALSAEAARFVPSGADARRQEWNNLIARELAENDIEAARGFALSAFAMLGPSDVSRLRRQMREGADDDEALLTAALPLVDPYARQRFRALIVRPPSGGFDVLGDARETAATADRWRAGEPVDMFLFKLGGLTLPAAGALPDDARLGASVIKTAKNGAHLTPQFTARIEAAVAAAAPDARLESELAAAFQNRAAIVDEGEAATLAFRRATDPEAFDALVADLSIIGAAARAASPSGAAMLLAHVRDARDLKRMALLAAAGGERAVAIGKRTPDGLVLNAARGQLRNNPQLFADITSVVLALLGMLIATHIAVLAALRREWEGAPAAPAATPQLSKADAQRRARAPEKMGV